MPLDINAQPGTNNSSGPWDNDPVDNSTTQGHINGPWDSDPIVPTKTPMNPQNWLSSSLNGTAEGLGGGNIPRSSDNGTLGVLSNVGRYAANNVATGLKNMGEAVNQTPQQVRDEAKAHQNNPFYISPNALKLGAGAMETMSAIPSAMGRALVADPIANAIGVDPNQRAWQDSDSLGMKTKKSLVDVAEAGGAMLAPTMLASGLKGAARAIIPEATPEAKALADEGVKLTPGEHYDKTSPLRGSEDLTETMPIIGGFIKGGKQTANDTFNDAIYNRALSDIGEDPLPPGLSGRQKVGYVKGQLDNFYDQVKPLINYTPDQNLSDLAEMIKGSRMGISDTTKQQFGDIADSVMSRGAMGGSEFKALDEDLGSLGLSYLRSGSSEDHRLGGMIVDLKNGMRENMAFQNPKIADQLQWANDAYSKFMTAQQASINRAGSLGDFSPNDLSSIIKRNNPRAFATGTAPMQDIADAAQAQLPDTVANSGTASRLAWRNIVDNPKTAVKGLLAAPLYTEKGSQAFSDIATRKPIFDNAFTQKPTGAYAKSLGEEAPSLVLNPKFSKRAVRDVITQEDMDK